MGVTDTFFMDQDTIYCFVTVGNVKKDTKVSTRWFLKESELEDKGSIEIGYFEQVISNPTNISFGLNQEQDTLLPIGKYEIIISLDDQAIVSSYFSVIIPPTPHIRLINDIPDFIEPSETIPCSYTWLFKGIEFQLEFEVPEILYNSYNSTTRIATISPLVYSLYISHPADDELITYIASELKRMAKSNGFTANEFGQLIISFVRNINYSEDIESTGFDEYPKYPIETLIDGEGDCEDSAILLAAIMQAGGMSPVLLLTKPTIIPGHCALGIAGEGNDDLIYYEYEGSKYYYVEATNMNLGVGHILEGYKPDDFQVVPLDPLPAITYSIDDFRAGRVHRIRTYVKNIGSTQVEGIKIISDIYSESREIIVSQETEPFTLSLGQEAIVIFYLPYKIPGIYELNVHAEHDGEVGYTLVATLDCP